MLFTLTNPRNRFSGWSFFVLIVKPGQIHPVGLDKNVESVGLGFLYLSFVFCQEIITASG